MPRFGEVIMESYIREWKPYYMNYNRLKGWIKEMESNHSSEAHNVFIEELETNLHRVDAFYLTQEAKIHERMNGTARMREAECSSDLISRECDTLDEDIKKLQSFAEVNKEGLRKITKKFDKKVGDQWNEFEQGLQARMMEVVKGFSFSDYETRLLKLENALASVRQGRVVQLMPSTSKRSMSYPALTTPLLELSAGKERPLNEWQKSVSTAIHELRKAVSPVILAIVVIGLAHLNLSNLLDAQSYFVIWVTGNCLKFLVEQWAPDTVLMGATLLLTITGVLTPKDAWQAFSNEVVLSVAALGAMASAVGDTGIINLVFSFILGKPKTLPVAMIRLLLPSIVLNLGISNTCVMSCLMPVIESWSKEIGIHRAFFLMPLSYTLLTSGVFAIFTTSTNLVAQGLLISHDRPPFDNFAMALPVTLCTVVELVYLMVASPMVLSRFKVKLDGSKDSKEAQIAQNQRSQNRYDVRVQVVGKVYLNVPLGKSGILDMLAGGMSDVKALERYGNITFAEESQPLQVDDVLTLRTSLEGVAHIFKTSGLNLLAFDMTEDYGSLDPSAKQLFDVVLDKQSPIVSHKIGDKHKYSNELRYVPIVGYRAFDTKRNLPEPSRRRKSMDVVPEDAEAQMTRQRSDDSSNKGSGTPLLGGGPAAFQRLVSGEAASGRGGHSIPKSGADASTRLQPGDHLIFAAPPSFYSTWRDSPEFVVVRKLTQLDGRNMEEQAAYVAPTAGGIMLGLIALVATSTLPLLEAVFLAIAALVMTHCTTMDAICKAVKLRTVFTIVGAFGLGKAIGQNHIAEVLANMLIWALGSFGHRGMLVAVFGATVSLGVIFHGTAVVVLMFPICDQVSMNLSMPIHQLMAVMCIAVSCQMLSPISYQTNLMAYSTGDYSFADFTKLGMGLVLCIALVAIPVCEWYFPGPSA